MLTHQDFQLWLSGFLDAAGPSISPEQVQIIQNKMETIGKPTKVDLAQPRPRC
jgi:hypothetical protein